MSDTTSMDKTSEIGLMLADCHACMGCVDMNPEIFEWDDDLDLPRLRKDRATAEEIQEALASCPKDCIYLVD